MLPLAIAPEWIVGGAAVLGALVGATAGGVTEWLLGWRRQKGEERAAARLVGGQISAAESQIAKAEETGKWWAFYGMPIDTWPENRDALALALKDADDFTAVAQAVMVLEGIREKIPLGPNYQQQIDALGFAVVTPSTLRPIREEAAKAWNALAPIAKDKPEGKLIQRD